MTWTMGDLANPGTLKIAEQAVAFYTGGMTPHVWTPSQVAAQTAQLRLALWTYGRMQGKDGGIIEAVECRDALLTYGYPRGSKVVIDIETLVDAEYIKNFEYLMSVFGYSTGVYGSLDTIEKNPLTQGGRWVAHYTGIPHFTGVPGEFACQWQKAEATGNEKPWDISAVKEIGGFWNIDAIDVMEAVLVQTPSGATRHVVSRNNGGTWS